MGNAVSEMQHIANQLQGVGPEEKAFIQAVFEQNVAEAKAQLDRSPNVIFARTRDWYNAWHLAARANNVAMLEMLQAHIKNNPTVRKAIPGEPMPQNNKSKKGLTPLMLACDEGHVEAMQYLLNLGANVLDIDMYGNTCVHYAAHKGHVKILELLLARAEADGGGDKAKRYTDLRNESGLMPLHFAVWGGKRAAAHTLIMAKCRLNSTCHADSLGLVTCNSGSTALHLAAMRGNAEMAQLLLEMWATMNAQPQRKKAVKDPRTLPDSYGFTPLQVAQNLLGPAARREGGANSAHKELLRLLDPITRINAPQRDEADFERQRFFLRTQSMRRSGSRHASEAGADPSLSGGAEGLALAPRPARLEELEAERMAPMVSEAPQDGLGAEVLARRAEDEAAEAAARAERDKASVAKASQSRAAAAEQAGLPPPKYVCPITASVMDDPVVASDGLSYERSALEMWLELGSDEFPGSGVRIADRTFTPNDELKKEIAQWRNFKT